MYEMMSIIVDVTMIMSTIQQYLRSDRNVVRIINDPNINF